MKNHTFDWELFYSIPIIGIVRGLTREKLDHILPAYHSAGFRNIEVTLNTPDAASIIQWLNEKYGEQMNVGAGTVCSPADLEKAVNAGAQFIVTPILNVDVIHSCVESKIPIFPGAYSPTEIYQAWEAGASMIKIFPASLGGVAYIKQIKGPLNNIKLLPTGGVSLENFSEFLQAGAEGFGIGGEIFDKKLIAANKWEELEEKMRHFFNKYQDFVSVS